MALMNVQKLLSNIISKASSTYSHACLNTFGTDTDKWTHICTHILIHMHTQSHTCTHARTHMHVRTHARTHIHTHTHTHAHKHTHTYTHTQTLAMHSIQNQPLSPVGLNQGMYTQLLTIHHMTTVQHKIPVTNWPLSTDCP